jgi:DNA-binding response OmpR family regulator
MSELDHRGRNPVVLVLADVASNAQGIIDKILKPAGIRAWPAEDPQAPTPDVLLVDITQQLGDPLGGLRTLRAKGDEAPAIVLAAHFPTARLRDLFRLGVADVMLKPYKGVELCKSIYALSEARSTEVTTQLLARRLQSTREQARRRSEEIRWLSEIGRTVVGLRNLESILTRVVEAAAFLTDAEEANIYLAEQGSREVVLRASKSAGETRGTLKRLRITDTLAGHVFRSGQPIVRQPEEGAKPVKVQTGFLVQSLIKVPVRIGQRPVGVLGVYNRLAPRPFSEHHVTLLGALADWAGVALEQSAGEPPAAPAEPPSAPPPTPATAQIPLDLIHGLEQLENELRAGLKDQTDPASQQRWADMLDRVIALRQLPMALLESGTEGSYIDLEQVAARVVDELRMAARQRSLELVLESNGRLPRLRGHQGRIHRVIEALTAAAIRRTQRGRIALTLRQFDVTAGYSSGFPLPQEQSLPDGRWVAVEVSDSSGGLSPDTVRALSLPEADPTVGSLGPGLSMGEVRLIAESMGGYLWHNHTAVSTSITFALPAG